MERSAPAAETTPMTALVTLLMATGQAGVKGHVPTEMFDCRLLHPAEQPDQHADDHRTELHPLHRAQHSQEAGRDRLRPGDAPADLQWSPGGHQDLQAWIP